MPAGGHNVWLQEQALVLKDDPYVYLTSLTPSPLRVQLSALHAQLFAPSSPLSLYFLFSLSPLSLSLSHLELNGIRADEHVADLFAEDIGALELRAH